MPPGCGEIFYLRTLLNYVKGPVSYDAIKIVDDVKYDTFKEACFAMGLLDDDKEFIDALNQVAQWGIVDHLRRLFVTLLVGNQFARPEVVWDKTWQNLSDDKRLALRV